MERVHISRDGLNKLEISGNGVTARISLASPSIDHTTNLLAYRARYSDFATVFINLSDLFPCIEGSGAEERPLCYRVASEEDGFNKGKAILEAADIGNNLNVWPNGKKLTYAFAIEGCERLDGRCLPPYYEFTTCIVCLLPRVLCG